MAHHDMNRMMSTREMVWELVSLPLRKAGARLVSFFENSAAAQSRLEAARKVAEMSDEDLARLGITRAQAIQAALGRFE